MLPARSETSSRDGTWRRFHHEELEARRQTEGRRYLGFLDEVSIQAGVYVLPAGGVNDQPAHDRDEVYVITAGRAVLSVAEEQAPVAAGSILFIRAGVPHRFVEVEARLHALVLFSAAESTPGDPGWAATTLEEVRRSARPDVVAASGDPDLLSPMAVRRIHLAARRSSQEGRE